MADGLYKCWFLHKKGTHSTVHIYILTFLTSPHLVFSLVPKTRRMIRDGEICHFLAIIYYMARLLLKWLLVYGVVAFYGMSRYRFRYIWRNLLLKVAESDYIQDDCKIDSHGDADLRNDSVIMREAENDAGKQRVDKDIVGCWNAQASRTDASDLEGRGKKEGLYRLGIGSEIDLVTWQHDLATEPSGRLAPPQAPLLNVLSCLQCKHCNAVRL